MKHSLATLIAATAIFILSACTSTPQPLKVLYWNIQNGMWDGQTDNYKRFTDWVQQQNPDICVWCESVTLYITNTAESMPQQERYLRSGWEELAARYGDQYVYMGGKRDNYPQVITSKYPIENVKRIIGNGADSDISLVCDDAADRMLTGKL